MTEGETTDSGRGWRNAVRLFHEEKKTYGDLLSFEWLYEAFEIEQPAETTSLKEAEKLKLQFLAEFKKFEAEMLTEYQMDIRSVRSRGYEVVHPQEQTRRAEQDFQAEMKRISRQVAGRLANVNHTLLSARERQQNADAVARLSSLRAKVREAFPKPLLAIEDEKEE